MRDSRFPDPSKAPADAPLALGADLRPAVLLDAYRHGIFPWPDGRRAVYWWSPDPRTVFEIGSVHVSRSLARVLRQDRFRTTVDADFAGVMAGCADRPGEGTWITPEMRTAYERLHELGHAHSLEVWDEAGALVGGIYGVTVGAVFTGESMFHRVSDASKVALVRLDEHLASRGFALLDAQLHTGHLTSMGAVQLPRAEFLRRLAALRDADVRFA